MDETTYDAVIVGAGPTGLLLAGDLAAAGVRVAVLEKRRDESNLTRAFGVHARTLEQFDARGLADQLVDTGKALGRLRLFGTVSVSLASLPTRFPFLLVTPQYQVERLLLERAVAGGVDLIRGARVIKIESGQDEVQLTVDRDGDVHTLTGRYVVGADGRHSTVRAQLGLDFPGHSVLRSLILADVQLTESPPEVLTVLGNQHGFCLIVPFGDGWYRVMARDPNWEPPDSTPVTLAEIATLVRRIAGTDYGMHSPRWMSRFHSDERQATAYRQGRVLLAGDAAHVHSPAGGMGMNTGLQDAANLGWKLAAVVQGRAGDSLLDTYEAERRPVGRMVLRTSGGLIRAVILRSSLARAARNGLFRAGIAVRPLGDQLRMRLSGIGVRYPAARGAHPLVGQRAPDLTAQDGSRLYTALRGGGFVLVDPDPSGPGYDHLVTFRPAEPTTPMLVRPDGYVAWAGSTGPDLDQALSAWGAVRPAS